MPRRRGTNDNQAPSRKRYDERGALLSKLPWNWPLPRPIRVCSEARAGMACPSGVGLASSRRRNALLRCTKNNTERTSLRQTRRCDIDQPFAPTKARCLRSQRELRRRDPCVREPVSRQARAYQLHGWPYAESGASPTCSRVNEVHRDVESVEEMRDYRRCFRCGLRLGDSRNNNRA